ncbi:DUF7144 family membrane protein [Nocardiopsis alkaliphila]|uniref:DUF7144 family membrane protein n=1 Tax=Nocardiopsis alkaliphila TaxID=225762 RepID=UPI0003460F6E|nr:hypothetical protein [Nocardiopsis alkaliphila]
MRAANGRRYFVCTLLVVIGLINVLQGLTAILSPGFFLAAESQMLLLEYEAWGFLLCAWGVVMVVAGAAVLSGTTWARAFGVVLASLNALVQLVFLIAMPLWSAIVIAIDVLVVYGLTAGWPAPVGQGARDTRDTPGYRAGYRAAHEKPAGTPRPTRSPEQDGSRRRAAG